MFREAHCLHQLVFITLMMEAVNSYETGKYLPEYSVLHPRRQLSSTDLLSLKDI
jgi:hypothetical protein